MTTPLGPSRLIDRRTLLRVGGLGLGALLLAACAPKIAATSDGSSTTTVATTLPGFAEFAATVTTTLTDGFWMIDSDGMPEHQMMTGITSWQQQVPVPQPYTGDNAWPIPSQPQLADDCQYHVAPLHLSERVGASSPIAYTLDGYAMYGTTEPDGSHVTTLDDFALTVNPFELRPLRRSRHPRRGSTRLVVHSTEVLATSTTR